MKTRTLIELLQKADPSGDEHVVVENVDILYVAKEPAYYDGVAERLIRDESKAPYYNVVGAEFISRGHKVVIHPFSIEDAILEVPDMPVETCNERTEKEVARWRKESVEARQ